ncbi:helix-turn-helix transcriptional regulator [Arthrobacter sp. efr-133-R2A-120]|uniref:helix-turn-helix transcriptional regulator n=1 Tax=Arthrobacter sp. efr-133-R2A-120 TaxID=3040277 RepID=UPI0025509805|nr:helix-turn-helix transcriptional regulator [Arthrobacter sp. efr-133-R2A-120]
MAKTIEQVVGENVKRLREQRGMSQVELGEEVGGLLGSKWVPQTVSAAERGKRQFIAAELLVLANVLGCRVQYLFEPQDSSSIRISDAFTFAPDFAAKLDASGVDDERLRRVYSKLRLTLTGLPALTATLREDLKKLEDITGHATYLLELKDTDDDVEDAPDA